MFQSPQFVVAPATHATPESGRIAPASIEKPIDSLRDQSGMFVVVDYLMEPPEPKGKLRNQVHAEIKCNLTAAGIRMFTEEETEAAPGSLRMELYLTPGDATTGCVF